MDEIELRARISSVHPLGVLLTPELTPDEATRRICDWFVGRGWHTEGALLVAPAGVLSDNPFRVSVQASPASEEPGWNIEITLVSELTS